MANTAVISFSRDLPQWEAVRNAVSSTGFGLELPADISLQTHDGFVPCLLGGEESGFEMSVRPASASCRDTSLSLIWRGAERDRISALIFASAVIRVTRGDLVVNGELGGSLEEIDAEIRDSIQALAAAAAERPRREIKKSVQLLRTTYGDWLEPRGFSSSNSHEAAFHRRISDELFHFIDFQLDRGTYFIRVYPSSPRLHADAWKGFPDAVPPAFGNFCMLNAKTGIGSNKSDFPCRDAGTTRKIATTVVIPALERFALPFLGRFRTYDDLKSQAPALPGISNWR